MLRTFQIFLCFAPLIILVLFGVMFNKLEGMCKTKDPVKDDKRSKMFNRIAGVYFITWIMLYACAWIVIVDLLKKV